MTGQVRWRYAVIALGFLGLAGVRAAQGAPVWAAVFLAAAAVNAWLARYEALRTTTAGAVSPAHTTGAGRTEVDRAEVDPAEVERSLDGQRSSRSQWKSLAVACLLVGCGLLMLEPLLAVFAAAAALFALHRAHRAGRAVATLQRARLAQR